MIGRKPGEKIEVELREIEEQRTRLAGEVERADARLARARERRPELAEIETRAFLGEAGRADVDRLRAELDREERDAGEELERLRLVGPELDRRLDACQEALRRARLEEARLARDKALAAQAKASEALRDTLREAEKAAVQLERRRRGADEATEAARLLLVPGETLEEPPDEVDFADGLERLLPLIEEGPRQPSVDAARREATRHRQDLEKLDWAEIQSRSGLVPWSQIGPVLPDHLVDEAQATFERLAEERRGLRAENDAIGERERGFVRLRRAV